MKVLFTSTIPYLPQIYGGLNTNTHELALELIDRGHQPAVLTRLSYGNMFGARSAIEMRLRGRRVSCDTGYGYPVFRARLPWMVLSEIPRPDVAVIQDGQMLQFAAEFAHLGVPAVSYFHGLDFEDWLTNGRPTTTADLPPIEYFANSEFTARRFQERYLLSSQVVAPVFRPERYRTDRFGKNVTFINPVAEKGVDLALEVALRCPEIPFVFVKAWPLSIRAHVRLLACIRRLPNVTLQDRSVDMRTIYKDCQVLLVPSKWGRETWGRVASEAQLSGIPVVGSDIGGLPEAVGPGGEIIGVNEPIDRWVCAIRRLWHDVDWYREKSEAAIVHSRRPELDIKMQVAALESGLVRAYGTPPKQMMRPEVEGGLSCAAADGNEGRC